MVELMYIDRTDTQINCERENKPSVEFVSHDCLISLSNSVMTG